MKYNKVILILAVSILVSYVLSLKYFKQSYNSTIILSEENDNHKKRPLDPGGLVIINSNSLIYEKLSPGNFRNVNVNLLPPPEVPLDLPFKNNKTETIYDSIDDILSKIDFAGEDEILTSTSSTENVVNDVPEQITNEFSNTKFEIVKLSEENNKLNNLNINQLSSGFKIHLSSAWSEQDAKQEWDRIRLRHIKYLKNAQLVIQKFKTKNGKIIYLVMAGNYPNFNQAKLLCKKLKMSKQNCIVVR